jgi:glycosyltransferase involved in cell wall biosynthesis
VPRVTVCIPTYKRTRWLADAIASALGQTFTDLVVEVHDDATPGDAVARVVDQFDDPRLRLIAHERNAGIVGNFTRSLLGAETEYVLQLGDDDVADPRLVEATVAALDAHPTAGVAHARFAIIDDTGATLDPEQDWLGVPAPSLESGAAFIERSMRYGCPVCSSTALIRRAAVPDGAFLQEDYPQFDFAFWLRMAERWDVAFVPESLCRYRVHANSHTSALSDITETGYLDDERTLREVHALKRRYLATLPDARRLERIADRALRRDLVGRVRTQTLPERALAPTVRGLRRAARREPRLLVDPLAWALLAGALLGPRRLDRLKGRA